MTEKILGCCGLTCTKCPAYIAKRTNDDELRKKTASEWSQPDYEVPPEDVNCDGCRSSGEIFKHWPTNCPVRNCVYERNLENCANCEDILSINIPASAKPEKSHTYVTCLNRHRTNELRRKA